MAFSASDMCYHTGIEINVVVSFSSIRVTSETDVPVRTIHMTSETDISIIARIGCSGNGNCNICTAQTRKKLVQDETYYFLHNSNSLGLDSGAAFPAGILAQSRGKLLRETRLAHAVLSHHPPLAFQAHFVWK